MLDADAGYQYISQQITCYYYASSVLCPSDFISNLFKQKVFSDPGSLLQKEQDTYFYPFILNEVEGKS